MKTSKFTTMELKKINKSSIYHFIYNARQTSKQETASALSIGLTTVSQNLKLLEEEGLITRQGFLLPPEEERLIFFKLQRIIRFPLVQKSIKDRIHLAAVNLYGELAASRTIQTPFLSDCGYCQALAKELDTFLLDYGIEASKILGVSIALQGIVSQNGSQIIYGKLLHEPDLSLSNFQNYIPFPCRLEHDSKAAAYREIWHKKEFKDSLILLLNENLGSALVIDGKYAMAFTDAAQLQSIYVWIPMVLPATAAKRVAWKLTVPPKAFSRPGGIPQNLFSPVCGKVKQQPVLCGTVIWKIWPRP